MFTLASIAAGLLLAITVFSIVVASKGVKHAGPRLGKEIQVDLGNNVQKAEINAIEHDVFQKAEQVRTMAETRAIRNMVVRKEAPARKKVEVDESRFVRLCERIPVAPAAASPAAPPSPAPAIEPAPEQEQTSDPMNETSFLKIIANKVEHVKKLSQDF